MKLRLSLLIIAVAVLASASVVTANRGVSEGRARSAKRKRPFAGAPVNAQSYRSSGLHKIIVSNDNTQAIADARSAGAVEISDYVSFKLFELDESALLRTEAIARQEEREPRVD